MKLIKPAHPETHEILCNAYNALQNEEITEEVYNEIVKSCFQAEAEWEILGHYPEAISYDHGEVVVVESEKERIKNVHG